MGLLLQVVVQFFSLLVESEFRVLQLLQNSLLTCGGCRVKIMVTVIEDKKL